MTVADVGSMTPAQARLEAKRILGDQARGIDPLREREAARVRGVLMSDLFERYLEHHANVHKKPASAYHDKMSIKKHLKPAFGRYPVLEVTRQQIVEWHQKMKDTPGGANRCLALLSKVFSCAELWGLRSDNPVRRVPRYKENKRMRFLSDAEFARLGKALREAEVNKTEDLSVLALFRLLALTGCRAGEIINLNWDQVDFEKRLIYLLDGKTGDRAVPMNPPTRKLLTELYEDRGDSLWVIKGRRRQRPLVAYGRPWKRICKAAKLDDFRVHDLRHSNASVGAAIGLSLPIIGAMLGHASPITTSRYAHLSNDPIRSATDLVGSRIASALDGKQVATVVEMQKRRRRSR